MLRHLWMKVLTDHKVNQLVVATISIQQMIFEWKFPCLLTSIVINIYFTWKYLQISIFACLQYLMCFQDSYFYNSNQTFVVYYKIQLLLDACTSTYDTFKSLWTMSQLCSQYTSNASYITYIPAYIELHPLKTTFNFCHFLISYYAQSNSTNHHVLSPWKMQTSHPSTTISHIIPHTTIPWEEHQRCRKLPILPILNPKLQHSFKHPRPSTHTQFLLIRLVAHPPALPPESIKPRRCCALVPKIPSCGVSEF